MFLSCDFFVSDVFMCFFADSLIHVHVQPSHACVHVHVLLSPFLRLSLLSLFPFLSLMLVCYTHIFHVHVYTCV